MSNNRAEDSRQRREIIGWKLDEAYHQAHGANSGSDLREANNLLQEIMEMFKDKSERMLREDHDACWERWVEIKETIRYKRKEICDFNYGHFKDHAYQAKGWAEDLPKDAKDKVKEVRHAMKGRTMEKWQYDEINDVLDEAWRVASAVLEDRHREWEDRIREKRSRLLGAVEYRQDKIRNRESQIDKCRDMLYHARSDEHRRRIEGWIDEHYSMIRDLENQIRDLQNAIDDIDNKLR